MGRLQEIEEHIEELKDYSNDQLRSEIVKTEETINNGEAWLVSNGEEHRQFEQCYYKFLNCLRRRAALYVVREIHPKEQDLFDK